MKTMKWVYGLALLAVVPLHSVNADTSSAAEQRREHALMKTVPLNVKFESGKSELSQAELNNPDFKKVAQELKNYPAAKLEIEGYADSVGSKEDNQKLSERRADAIRLCFIDKYGVPAERVTTKGYGEMKPEVANDSWQGRQMNRKAIARIYRLNTTAGDPKTQNL